VLAFVMSMSFCVAVKAGPADDLVSVANAQEGKKAANYGFTSNWCAWFVEWCGNQAGLYSKGMFPANKSYGRVTELCNWFLDNNKGTAYYALPGELHTSKNSQKISKSSFTPRKGDLICFTWNGNYYERFDHIGIVTAYSNGTVYYTHGNSGSTGSYATNYVRVNTAVSRTNSAIAAYIRPNYGGSPAVNQDPVFNLERIEGGAGKVTVVGWCFDPDNPSASLPVHVYVGGYSSTAGAEGNGDIVANVYRPDVNAAYGITGNHGFSVTFDTNKRGNQIVSVYAINTPTGYNPTIGYKTVNITEPYKLTFNKSSVNVNENATTSLVVGYGGENINFMNAVWEGTTDIADVSWGANNGSAQTQEIVIKGKKAGSKKLKVQLLDANQKEVYAKSITITVNHVHNYTTKKVTKQATCTANGIRSTYCACGAVSSVTETIPATGHKGGTATCTAKAKCTVCNASYGDYKAHSYNTTWTIDKKATCETAGSKSHHCKNCSAKKDVTIIAATGHKGGTATCTAKAKCSTCGKSYGELKEHKYEDGKCITCGAKTEASRDDEDEEDYDYDEEEDDYDENEEPVMEVEIGDILEDEETGVSYEVTGLGATNTVEYLGSMKKAKVVSIPNQVKLEGVIYKVTSIAEGAFANNKKVTKIVVGNNVVKIGAKAFSKCKNLKNMTMGSSVQYIGAKAFYGCSKLTKITIPANVSKIGKAAFYGCRKLKSITIKSKNLTTTNVGAKAFKYIYSKANIRVPEDKKSEYKKLLRKKGATAKVKVK